LRPGGAAAARRYARALLEVAKEKKQAQAIKDELAAVVNLVSGHGDLAAVVAHPAVSAERKRKLMAAVAEKARLGDLMARLLALLGERDRLEQLPAIAEAYTKLWNEERGVVAAEVVSATPLDEAQAGAVAQALGRLTGGAVDLRARVDPALLGGVQVRMQGRTYDGSVRARLAALRRRLSGDGGQAT
jgi:F-type H+-transporting ATPase subunit delta